MAAQLTELSLYSCYVETLAPFDVRTQVLVKVFRSAEYFEAKATVIFVKPALGMGLAFREVEPTFRAVLQKWILAAIHDRQTSEQKPA